MNWSDDGPKPCIYCWMHAHRLCSGGDCACTHPSHYPESTDKETPSEVDQDGASRARGELTSHAAPTR